MCKCPAPQPLWKYIETLQLQQIHRCTTSFAQMALSVKGAKFWTSLPDEVFQISIQYTIHASDVFSLCILYLSLSNKTIHTLKTKSSECHTFSISKRKQWSSVQGERTWTLSVWLEGLRSCDFKWSIIFSAIKTISIIISDVRSTCMHACLGAPQTLAHCLWKTAL